MRIWVSIKSQHLELYDDELRLVRAFVVSTAKKGPGESKGSFRTPRGRHMVRAKIGSGAAENAVFVRRRPTGELWSPEFAAAYPDRDWILTRILWLSGLDIGFNRLGDVDTMRRYIYIHGSPDTAEIGRPGSIGCIRMRNRDIVELFDLVPPYTRVDIVEYAVEEGAWATLGAEAGPLREQIFVEEQGVPREMEYDEFDATSLHVLARDMDDRPIGTGRLLPDGHLGRLAVAKPWRGKGVGTALLARLIDVARRRGMSQLALHSQTAAAGFYRRFGFLPEGSEFLEAGIPHILMRRALQP